MPAGGLKAWDGATVDPQTRIGVKVDCAGVDWGTVVARRGQEPTSPGQGGGQMRHTSLSDADCIEGAIGHGCRRPTYYQRPFSYDPAGRMDANTSENCREFPVRELPPTLIIARLRYQLPGFKTFCSCDHHAPPHCPHCFYWPEGPVGFEISWRPRIPTCAYCLSPLEYFGRPG